jgi:glycosyltransferase involved in cell wall biosynthesis
VKILYLVHQFYPEHYTGTEKFLLNLTKSMQRFGHQVKVVTYQHHTRQPFEETAGRLQVRRYNFEGVPVIALQHLVPPQDVDSGFINPAVAEFARQLLAAEQPDLLHVAHSMRVGEFVRVAQEQGLPYLVTLTDFFLLCPKCNLMTSNNSLCAGPEQGNACRRLCPELSNEMVVNRLGMTEDLLRQAQRIVAPSKFLAGLFKSHWNDLDIELNGYGISSGKIQRNTRQYAPGQPLTFFYGGSFIYHKGVHILIAAFRKLKGTATLKLYGSGHLRETLEKLAGGDKRIEFCGVFAGDKLSEILNQVDVAVVPSIWYENTPIMMLEAQAAAVPVIVTDLGGMTERIQHGVNGYAFRIGDSDSLQEVLQNLVNQPEQLNELKANIRKQAIHTVEQEALAYERVYREIERSRVR